MSNAYGCTKHENIGRHVEEVVPEKYHDYFWQRRSYQVATVDCSDGKLEVLLGDGGMMGDGKAPSEYLSSFHSDAIEPWQTEQFIACP